ncbi:MAG: CRISPR-associated helicase Cas3' [Firmicutes bacterium]|jgi:CRISPR-associated endonuclease/helicase Cas3|nr:CRISPR-associated helicase Cas3' [Bacillota bacterium]
MNISKFIDNDEKYLAHLNNCGVETLKEHSELTYEYFSKILLEDKIDIEKIIESSLNEEYMDLKDYICEMFHQAIYYHDIGKINKNFQIEKMKNYIFGKDVIGDSNHSLLSSLIYIDIQLDKIIGNDFSRKAQEILFKYVVDFSYIISRHHGYLKDMKEYGSKIIDLIYRVEENERLIEGYIYKERLLKRELKIYQYIFSLTRDIDATRDLTSLLLNKLLYGGIVASDFYATNEYMMGNKIDQFGGISDIRDFTKKYYSDALINKIINTDMDKKVESINDLRSKMFKEAERNLVKNLDKNIFYLEAPTGSGKTITSINLAVNILEKCPSIKKMVYVFPFNTLVDQTQKVLTDFFKEENIAVLNSLSPIKLLAQENDNYDKAYTDRIFQHYNITLTSHVKFFSNLIGVGRESHLPLFHLANSVAIIDEIQSYKNMIWSEIITVLERYSELLNIKFIIMSATLPKLSMLTKNTAFVSLIEKPEVYFENTFFKNRVLLDFELLDRGKINLEQLSSHMKNNVIDKNKGRILIEFIDKLTAREFYNLINNNSDFTDYEIFELTGDDNLLYRENLIGKLKEKKDNEFVFQNVIVVATQVIEAGVDIDMNIGYKDISIIDSEEQFVGRINRSCLRKDCKVYFFDYFETKSIYKNDVRINYSLKNKNYRNLFIDKNFNMYFKDLLEKLQNEKQKNNNNSIKKYEQMISDNDYLSIYKHMKLIDDNNYTIYIPSIIKSDMKVYDGYYIWNKYKKILFDKDMSFTKKQVELSKVRRELSYFTYNVKYIPQKFEEAIGDMYFLSDGQKYLDNGKFDRKKYNDINKGSKVDYEDMIL